MESLVFYVDSKIHHTFQNDALGLWFILHVFAILCGLWFLAYSLGVELPHTSLLHWDALWVFLGRGVAIGPNVL